MRKPENIPEDVWDLANECAGSVQMPGGEGHAILRAELAEVIMAAKAEERIRVRDAVVGHIMTVVESLMEGRMTDAGLTKKDHIEMQAQIEALDVVADEIQALTFKVNTAHKNFEG